MMRWRGESSQKSLILLGTRLSKRTSRLLVATILAFSLTWIFAPSAPANNSAHDSSANSANDILVEAFTSLDGLNESRLATVTEDVEDSVPPATSITSPADGTVVGGTISIKADATDDNSISRVQLLVDGYAFINPDYTSPYEFPWNTASFPDGEHTLTTIAEDQSGNRTTSLPVTIIVDNTFPTITFNSPTGTGEIIGGTTLVTTTEGDNLGIDRVELYVDNALVSTATTSPYDFSLDTTPYTDGEHLLTAVVYDLAGNQRSSSTEVFTDNISPSASIDFPSNGQSLSGQSAITARATDNLAGVSKVEFYIDNILVHTDTTRDSTLRYSFLGWDTTAYFSGSHVIQAKAYDAAGNVGSSATVTVTIDNIGPTTSITSPADGSTVSGAVSVQADASDNAGVTKVEFYVDGVLTNTDTVAPYGFSWDTATASNTSHTVLAKAYDAAGNVGSSATVTVTIDNIGPTTSITSPADGSTVSGAVSVQADASDNAGVTKVEFYVDGVLTNTDTVAPYGFSWDTATYAHNSTHTLSTKVFDTLGNIGVSAVITVTVSDVISPTVSITSPLNGGQVLKRSVVSITANAADFSGIDRVEFYVNNVLICTDTTAPYSCNWTVPNKSNSTYSLKAQAYDAAGNMASHTITVTSR